MASKLLKCQHCGEVDIPYSEKNNEDICRFYKPSEDSQRKYFHAECYGDFLEHQEFIDEEMKQKDELNLVMKDVHGIPEKYQLPVFHWKKIQDLRNGTTRYLKGVKLRKEYKKGVEYEVIAEAYKICKSKIKWKQMSNQFTSIKQEVSYCFKMVCDSLFDAHRSLERKKRESMIDQAKQEQYLEEFDYEEEREAVYVKKENKNDFSDLLD